MAFPARSDGRPKSLIFRHSMTLADDPADQAPAPLSPVRNMAAARPPQPPPSAADLRNNLQRRFTTNALPALAPIGEQRRQQNAPADAPWEPPAKGGNARITHAENRARQYEALLQQQRRIQAQMAMIDPETRREVDEAQKLEQDITLFTSGVLSRTSSPSGQPVSRAPNSTAFNRFSTSSLSSSLAGIPDLRSHAGAQMTSPPADYVEPFLGNQEPPLQSVPGSRQDSEHEGSDGDDHAFAYKTIRQKAGANPNRNSMPVTSFDLRAQNRHSASFSPVLGPVGPSSFYFGDDDGRKSKRSSTILNASPDAKTFLQLHQTDDQFPILVRRGTDTQFSGTVTPLEMPEDSGPEGFTRTDRTIAARHQQSLPPNVVRNSAHFGDGIPGLSGILADTTSAKNPANNRRSLEVKFGGLLENKRPGLMVSPLKTGLNGLNKVPSSYSTNDIPTLKTVNAMSQDNKAASTAHTPKDEISSPLQGALTAFSQQQPSATSQALQGPSPVGSDQAYRSMANGRSYIGGNGAVQDVTSPSFEPAPGALSYNGQSTQYGRPASMYNAYSVNALNDAFSSMALAGPQASWSAQVPQQNGASGYGQYPPQGGRYPPEGFGRPPVQPRRVGHQNDDSLRIANTPLEALKGEIYGLCKDQHGCRFLQKKLEERNPDNTRMIFEETLPHVVELMTDPFGNYLCQKLLEYAADDQRTSLIDAASAFMIKIALNQHGTRALQKMIEFINTQEQINMVIQALRNEVVQLIQDLNGNHVIQKCLNHLKQDNIQFIVDAVCVHVVTVGTHRHGCCVLQRCVDHASGLQKGQLVASITRNVFALVQDPFGNYVVQYILDLGEPSFSEPLCQSMIGSVPTLACQKFSSNVIEKGIRTAGDDTRRHLIREMLNPADLQRMLRDSFANYVVQTAMDYADEETRVALFDVIRPMLPNIRHTPHGRRISTKIQEADARNGVVTGTSGAMAPYSVGLPPAHEPAGRNVYYNSGYGMNGHGMGGNPMPPHMGFAPPPPPRAAPHHPHHGSQHFGGGYGNGPARFGAYPSAMDRSGVPPQGMNQF